MANGFASHDAVVAVVHLNGKTLDLSDSDRHLIEDERPLPPMRVEALQVLLQIAPGHPADLRGDADLADGLLHRLWREEVGQA